MQVTTIPVILKDHYMLSPSVKHFVFHALQEPAFDYIAGQFITVHFEHQGKALKRSYSIANPPKHNNHIEFAAGRVENGPGTEFLFNLNIGDIVNVSGPYGRLILKNEPPKRYILVATSTGITPYRAMIPQLKHLVELYPEVRIIIMQGVRTREDILYNEEFSTLASLFPRIQFRAHLSRYTKGLQEFEHTGYVQHAFDELELNPTEDIIYLCGNPSMVDASFELLKEKGFEAQQIVREKYLSR
ncbi:MAG: FAD-binding oxidoreductase [Legionella sp.]